MVYDLCVCACEALDQSVSDPFVENLFYNQCEL